MPLGHRRKGERRAALDLLRGLALSLTLAGCHTTSPITAPTVRELHYSGTLSKPAPGGAIVAQISGVWKIDEKGALISGADTTHILDAKVYGYPGTPTFVGKTQCVGIDGKDAWAQFIITETSDPQFTAVGSYGVLRLSDAGGKAQANAGPRDVIYSAGNICIDKPQTVPLFDLTGGAVSFP